MNSLFTVPIISVTNLSSERAVDVIRSILRAECNYAKLSPTGLTISGRLTIADGGIDAEVNVPAGFTVPTDCIFQTGLTGFQIKSGTTFKPWTLSAIQSELLDSKGELSSEVKRLLQRNGRYAIVCTGHDLTPEQRNDSRQHIASVLAEIGFEGYEELIEVLGASQIAEYAERYPGTASLLTNDPIQEALVLEEWQQDSHMANSFEVSPEQSQLIGQIQTCLQGETKHIRILGEPGLGKTRIVLESVKDKNIAPFVLYFQHGSQFGQTKLFRQLLKTGYDKPLVLVIDELPELELSDIWRNLKPRCGNLKVVSLDHGRDETHDEEIVRLYAPLLPESTIKKILISQVGESREIDRWVSICEGSPRVALAVADNLRANPDDILKPPSTIPIWDRFLHGYGRRDEFTARQVDCVAQHFSLFSRVGYEAPVGDEAIYLAELIHKVDPTIGWARFQEIIQNLRARRVLQGSRTLFFVPKALHIYLWKHFWIQYGHGFDFTKTLNEMPESLHVWFLNMFKYAGDSATGHVINDILRPDGIFSETTLLMSGKGARFLSILAEANPAAVMKLLEATIGKWTDQALFEFKQHRQNIVWALEKIAVWPALTVRAIKVLARLAVNENADFSNNSTGTLVGLFCIGPEEAATESTPEERLPAILMLLRASGDTERRLGLKAMETALDSRGMRFRIVGPEYQGLKERANLWIPETYDEWWNAKHLYFQTLVDETRDWPSHLRTEVCLALLEAVWQQIRTPPCTELAFQVLDILVDDNAMPPGKLNKFFWYWQEYEHDKKHPEIAKRLRIIQRRHTRRDLASRFQRYVIDVNWLEWDEDFREQHNKPKNRSKILVNALARRIALHPVLLNQIQHLLSPEGSVPALWYFGEQMAMNDESRTILPLLIRFSLENNHKVCLHGYLSAMQISDPHNYLLTICGFLSKENSAWLGATIALQSKYDDDLFVQCLVALEKSWIAPGLFSLLRFGKAIESIPPDRTVILLQLLDEHNDQESLSLLVELLDSLKFSCTSSFNSDFVFRVVSKAIPNEMHHDVMKRYHWKNVCLKLIPWDIRYALPLLDVILTEMGKSYSLSYDGDVASLANELVLADPAGAWKIVKAHFESTLPLWRSDLLNWLKGGLSSFNEEDQRGPIADLPIQEIIEWIEEDTEPRAVLMAHAVPGTLDVEKGGRLTRELLLRYGHIEDVRSGISATFHSGGWTGPASAYYKRKRARLRQWLATGFEPEIIQWIETEIDYIDRDIEREEINEERSRFD